VNRFSDRRVPLKKLFGFRIWRIFYADLRILLIQRIADLCNILARIVDFSCNLVRILDCDFIVELLADPNLDKTIVGSRILLQIWADRRICIPLFTPPPLQIELPAFMPTSKVIFYSTLHSSVGRQFKTFKIKYFGAFGLKILSNEERSETNPLVYGRKRENQRYQSYQGSNVLHFL
jgi:hypothetical protein